MRLAALALSIAVVAVGSSHASTFPLATGAAYAAPDSFLVSTSWLAAHLNDRHLVILQVDMGMSGDAPFAAGHIPGARELPYGAITVERDGLNSEMPTVEALRAAFEAVGVSDSSHVVVYYSSEAPSATRAVFALDYLGHKRVSFLDGGFPKWRAEGRAISKEKSTFARGTLHPHPQPSLIATAPWIESRIGRGIALIDTRTDGEYLGSGIRHGMPSEGHLAGAKQLQWEQLFVGDSGSASGAPLKDRAALTKLYADRMHPGDTVVTYCWVGYRASATYLAARSLGLPVKLYDGSYEDWARRKLPLTKGSTP
jgi:thiosulfate/3-mercaptopyruvate sulfurtransferase